jgi:tetratricopeptide (TPR) repeat protein
MTFEPTAMQDLDDSELERAFALLNLGQYREAEELAACVLARDARNVLALTVLCEVKFRLADFRSARSFAERVIELAPQWSQGYRSLAVIALHDLNFAVARTARWWQYEGNDRSLARFRAARATATTAAELDPSDAQNYLILAEADVALGRLQDAEESLSLARLLDPDNKQIRLFQIEIYRRTNRLTLARQHASDLLAHLPDDADAHAAVAVIAEEQGDHAASLLHARESLQREPDSAGKQALYWKTVGSQSLLLRPAAFLNRFLAFVVRMPFFAFLGMMLGLLWSIRLLGAGYEPESVRIAVVLVITPLLFARMLGERINSWFSDILEPLLLTNRSFRKSRTPIQRLDLSLTLAFCVCFFGLYAVGAVWHDGRYVALAWLSGLVCAVTSGTAKLPPSRIKALIGAISGVWAVAILNAVAGMLLRPAQPVTTMLVASYIIGCVVTVVVHIASSSERKSNSVPRPS